jgi:diacylglycerol kinase family enzyme
MGRPGERTRRLAAVVALLAQAMLVLQIVTLAVSRVEELVLLLVTLALVGKAAWWAIFGGPLKRWAGITIALLAAVALAVQVLWNDPGTVARHAAIVLNGLIFLVAVGLVRSARGGGSVRPASIVVPRSARRAVLFHNARAGTGRFRRTDLEGRGFEVRDSGSDIGAAAEQAAREGFEVLAVAGGDGSLSPVAAVALRHNLPLLVVPGGTFNHFARDLGLDLGDPLASLAGLEGEERRVDVGRVNGRVFLNNVSFGVYASIVREPGYRAARLETAQRVLSAGLTRFDLQFRTPEGREIDGALLLMAGNNRYDLFGLYDFGERFHLDDGLLDVLALETGGAAWLRWTAKELEVRSKSGRIDAAIDGEPVTFASPARVAIEPGALRVLVPFGTPRVRENAPAPFTPAAVAELLRAAAGR